jgi:AcrR family transcriptional regulator
MPKEVDVEQKRSEFADATWRVIRKEGLSAATLRRVAAEARCTTGALTHYFSNREALLVEALRRAHFAAGARMIEVARKAQGDFKRLEAIVLEALPLDSERTKEWKTRLSVWSAASDNELLRQENTRRYQEWNELLRRYLVPIVPRRDALRREAVLLMGLIDGLALRLLLHAPSGEGMQAAVSEAVVDVRFHLRAMHARYRGDRS